MEISWSPRFCVGDEAIDHQHEILFRLADAFIRSIGVSERQRCADQLYDYSRNHFAYEEALMRRVGFPGLEDHVQAHKQLLERLETLSHRISNDSLDQMELQAFLQQLTVLHFRKEDAKLVHYLGYDETRKGELE